MIDHNHQIRVIFLGEFFSESNSLKQIVQNVPLHEAYWEVDHASEPVLQKLNPEAIDLAVIGCKASDVSSFQNVLELSREFNDIPFVVITDEEDEAKECGMLHEGIQDVLVLKGLEPETLWKSVRFSIERFSSKLQLRSAVDQDLHDETGQSLKGFHEREEKLKKKILKVGESKDTFLSQMSHEIRTPLTVILGYSDVLLDQLREPADIDATLAIRRNGQHLLDILSDVADFALLESRNIKIEKKDCSPIDLVDDIVRLMSVRAEAKNLELTSVFSGILPRFVQTDKTRLKQVILNLIGNAIKFTETGEVRVTTSMNQQSDGKQCLEIEVKDTGLGIPMDELPEIFEPFSKSDLSIANRSSGTGLGLAICKEISHVLGGEISVSSSEQGSTFLVSIPVEFQPLCQAEAKPSSDGQGASSGKQEANSKSFYPSLACRILLAEDGVDNQRLITLMLEKTGAEVVVAENGKIAFEKATAYQLEDGLEGGEEHKPYDMILMDMQMPVMDGYDATALLRANGFDKPIIAITAHALDFDRNKCLDAGCNDYLEKPINRKRFFEVITSYAPAAKDL